MGGVRVGGARAGGPHAGAPGAPTLETDVANLFAAGEAVGGANGANRLSGNAITEAFAFGRRAGREAAARAAADGAAWRAAAAEPASALIGADGPALNTAAMIVELQDVMATRVGPFRTEAKLAEARARIAALRAALGAAPPGSPGAFDLARLDWFDLRNMLLVAETVALSAQCRTESRGAHQREDHPSLSEAWRLNQTVRLEGGGLRLERHAVPH
jgi:succinate dehydrogenase/fumarate reductase flavoprotein subunit